MLIRWLNAHTFLLKFFLHSVLVTPFALLVYLYACQNLGANPFEELISQTGITALITLLCTLSITPLRRWSSWLCRLTQRPYGKRLSDWNFLIRTRRMWGLWSFFYACCHVSIYLHFEVDWDWSFAIEDIIAKNYIQLGIGAWILYFVLAITSPNAIQKRMGRWWRICHRGVYIIVLLVLAHAVTQEKYGQSAFWLYSTITAILLGHRVLVAHIRKLKNKGDDDMEHLRK